jgi:hypothetical protein
MPALKYFLSDPKGFSPERQQGFSRIVSIINNKEKQKCVGTCGTSFPTKMNDLRPSLMRTSEKQKAATTLISKMKAVTTLITKTKPMILLSKQKGFFLSNGDFTTDEAGVFIKKLEIVERKQSQAAALAMDFLRVCRRELQGAQFHEEDVLKTARKIKELGEIRDQVRMEEDRLKARSAQLRARSAQLTQILREVDSQQNELLEVWLRFLNNSQTNWGQS